MPRFPSIRAPFGALFGPEPSDARQSLVALGIGLLASLVGGITLAAISGTLADLPGLLVLVPAAIMLRGAIFGALGARLGTSIHTGTFRLSARSDTVVGQNLLASVVLTVVASVGLAFLAKAVVVGFGVDDTVTVADFVVISFVGGVLASVFVMVLTVLLAANSVRFSWDLDNVMAPIVTAAGDMVTLPALFVGTLLIGLPIATPSMAVVAVLAAVVLLAVVLRSRLDVTRRIVVESLPIILVASLLSLVAGLTLEGRLSSLVDYPSLLVLVPPFLASAGAIGGILSSRLTSKLHLGVIAPTALPGRGARDDILLSYAIAVPVFVLASVVADVAAIVVDLASPGALDMVLVAVAGGLLATTLSVAVAYYGAIVSFRMGVDPDNVGIPLVTSSIDLFGSVSFIIAVAAFVAPAAGA
jgi:mgtE-like transporter